ncbi:MAG TPA: heparan-alpha-glucosaminide N-acetyltransferase domain-containing protein [Gemmatimonadaceae bacterium]
MNRSRFSHVARVNSIDVARGAAMFFVCLSHFTGAYLWQTGMRANDFLVTVSMIASPSFVLISGMMFGFLRVLNPVDLPHLRIRLLDRGVFLLVIGHFLLAVSQLRRSTMTEAYYGSFLTDALAVAIMLGPRIVDVSRGPLRIAIAISLYCASWLMLARWHPSGSGALLIQRYVIGSLPSEIAAPRTLVFPLLPWLSVYLLGTVLGEHVGYFYRRREAHRARRLFLLVGSGCMLLGTITYVVTRYLGPVHSLVSRSMLAVLLTSPTLKFPPGPAYIAYFGGSGLVFMWLVLELEARRRLPLLTEWLRRVGYASLPVFLLQGFVYSAVVRSANLPYSAWWPLLFLFSLVPMWALASVWSRADANRLLTVGITAWLERQSHPAVVRASRLARVSRPGLKAISSLTAYVRARS